MKWNTSKFILQSLVLVLADDHWYRRRWDHTKLSHDNVYKLNRGDVIAKIQGLQTKRTKGQVACVRVQFMMERATGRKLIEGLWRRRRKAAGAIVGLSSDILTAQMRALTDRADPLRRSSGFDRPAAVSPPLGQPFGVISCSGDPAVAHRFGQSIAQRKARPTTRTKHCLDRLLQQLVKI